MHLLKCTPTVGNTYSIVHIALFTIQTLLPLLSGDAQHRPPHLHPQTLGFKWPIVISLSILESSQPMLPSSSLRPTILRQNTVLQPVVQEATHSPSTWSPGHTDTAFHSGFYSTWVTCQERTMSKVPVWDCLSQVSTICLVCLSLTVCCTWRLSMPSVALPPCGSLLLKKRRTTPVIIVVKYWHLQWFLFSRLCFYTHHTLFIIITKLYFGCYTLGLDITKVLM